jgi:hypothetical protein
LVEPSAVLRSLRSLRQLLRRPRSSALLSNDPALRRRADGQRRRADRRGRCHCREEIA